MFVFRNGIKGKFDRENERKKNVISPGLSDFFPILLQPHTAPSIFYAFDSKRNFPFDSIISNMYICTYIICEILVSHVGTLEDILVETKNINVLVFRP